MSQDSEDFKANDEILMFITESGFKVVPFQAIIDALAQMEDYIKTQTGIDQEELDFLLGKIEDLVGKQEAMSMEVEDIIRWINVFRST